MTTSLKKILKSIAIIVFIATIAAGCRKQVQTVSHVIILGFDSMSARDIQRAKTPNFNRMIENGAVSLHTRCVRETTSSQNWMSMVSAAPIEMHGVLNNSWKKDDAQNLMPALWNRIGLFPTIFDLIREQKPNYRQYAFIEWAGETRMYDTEVFDSCCVFSKDPDLHEKMDVMRKAISTYLSDRPEMMFVSMDITDHAGHTFGHESDQYLSTVSQMDSLTGILVSELEKRGWMKNTVILITADHGGLGFGHGGDTIEEYEIPVIVFGGRTTNLPNWDKYFFIDCSYIRLFVIGGLLLFVLILLMMTYTQLRCFAYRNYGFVFLLALLAVSCLMEHHLMEYFYNVFPLMAFSGGRFLKETGNYSRKSVRVQLQEEADPAPGSGQAPSRVEADPV